MPRIPPESIEQVAAANDIVEVIGGYFPLKRMGGTFKALCPFHQERTPSFNVNPHRQIFKCFGCGAGGSVFRFVMDYEHIDFLAAVRKLADKAGIKIPEAEMTQEDYARADLRRRLLSMHADAAEFFHMQLMRGNSADAAREYMKKRGLGAEVAKAWKIGFAPDSWDGLLGELRRQGYKDDELAASGLFSSGEDGGRIYDRFRGRLMFPICNDTGEVIAFSGRVLNAEQSPAKYVNSPETILFTKGAVLFGLHKSKRALIDRKQAVVCEGQVDLITAFEAGVQNVIAPQGTAFTDRQARILKRYVEEVVLCFDSDAAGEKAAQRSLPHLLRESLGVRVVAMPPGEDPDSLIRTEGAEAFQARIAQAEDFFDYQIRRQSRRLDFGTPRGKIAAAQELAALIALIPDGVARDAVQNNAAMRLEVSPQDFRALVKRAPQAPQNDGEETKAPQKVQTVVLDPTKELLALLALRDQAARAWLQCLQWTRVLEDGLPDSVLLGKIFDAEFRVDDPASVNAWITTLDPGEEITVSAILEKKAPLEARVVAEDCWNELERRELVRRRQAVEAKLRAPGLPFEEMVRIHEDARELQRQITALPPPRAPRAPE
ncbi:MAG: DNA primase [Chthoniobacteraceae bacterium]